MNRTPLNLQQPTDRHMSEENAKSSGLGFFKYCATQASGEAGTVGAVDGVNIEALCMLELDDIVEKRRRGIAGARDE